MINKDDVIVAIVRVNAHLESYCCLLVPASGMQGSVLSSTSQRYAENRFPDEYRIALRYNEAREDIERTFEIAFYYNYTRLAGEYIIRISYDIRNVYVNGIRTFRSSIASDPRDYARGGEQRIALPR